MFKENLIWRCPKCGNTKEFSAVVYGHADMDEFGTLTNVSVEREEDGFIQCKKCKFRGREKRFLISKQ